MICGYLPFDYEDRATLYKYILKCKYRIPSQVSPPARDLITRILVRNPDKRISLDQIKKHSWFNEFERDSPLASGILPTSKNIHIG